MTRTIAKLLLLSAAIGIGATTAARADCESDLLQLETAFKATTLTPVAKTALEEAKTKAVAALKKDDDKSCNIAIKTGMTKAGLTLK